MLIASFPKAKAALYLRTNIGAMMVGSRALVRSRDALPQDNGAVAGN
jgi:hypothetical protein